VRTQFRDSGSTFSPKPTYLPTYLPTHPLTYSMACRPGPASAAVVACCPSWISSDAITWGGQRTYACTVQHVHAVQVGRAWAWAWARA
jgi:hypothetical protein